MYRLTRDNLSVGSETVVGEFTDLDSAKEAALADGATHFPGGTQADWETYDQGRSYLMGIFDNDGVGEIEVGGYMIEDMQREGGS